MTSPCQSATQSPAVETMAARLVGQPAPGLVRFGSLLEAKAAVVRALAIQCPRYHARAGAWCRIVPGDASPARAELCVPRLTAPPQTARTLARPHRTGAADERPPRDVDPR